MYLVDEIGIYGTPGRATYAVVAIRVEKRAARFVFASVLASGVSQRHVRVAVSKASKSDLSSDRQSRF